MPTVKTPVERVKQSIAQDNLWVYVLALATREEICDQDVARLIFEKFGFLPAKISVTLVLTHLKKGEYIRTDKREGKKSYIATEKGKTELENLKSFLIETKEKIEKI
jgi:DNA-binding PadR family transcriptional regulator